MFIHSSQSINQINRFHCKHSIEMRKVSLTNLVECAIRSQVKLRRKKNSKRIPFEIILRIQKCSILQSLIFFSWENYLQRILIVKKILWKNFHYQNENGIAKNIRTKPFLVKNQCDWWKKKNFNKWLVFLLDDEKWHRKIRFEQCNMVERWFHYDLQLLAMLQRMHCWQFCR